MIAAYSACGILLVCLIAALIRNRTLSMRLAALRAESARALEDEGLMAQLEVAEASGSTMARALLDAGRAAQLALPKSDNERGGQRAKVKFQILDGQARELWDAEYRASTTVRERRKMHRSWHNKGYQFPHDWRILVIKNCQDEKGRDFYRKLFDEQDKRASG